MKFKNLIRLYEEDIFKPASEKETVERQIEYNTQQVQKNLDAQKELEDKYGTFNIGDLIYTQPDPLITWVSEIKEFKHTNDVGMLLVLRDIPSNQLEQLTYRSLIKRNIFKVVHAKKLTPVKEGEDLFKPASKEDSESRSKEYAALQLKEVSDKIAGGKLIKVGDILKSKDHDDTIIGYNIITEIFPEALKVVPYFRYYPKSLLDKLVIYDPNKPTHRAFRDMIDFQIIAGKYSAIASTYSIVTKEQADKDLQQIKDKLNIKEESNIGNIVQRTSKSLHNFTNNKIETPSINARSHTINTGAFISN